MTNSHLAPQQLIAVNAILARLDYEYLQDFENEREVALELAFPFAPRKKHFDRINNYGYVVTLPNEGDNFSQFNINSFKEQYKNASLHGGVALFIPCGIDENIQKICEEIDLACLPF